MRSKAPLVMMEQIVMVLIFALAAALCLQIFVLSGKLSKQIEAENNAAIKAQNIAETIKAEGLASYLKKAGPEASGEKFRMYYDEDWNCVTEQERAAYYLEICPENQENEYFWKAEIVVTEQDGTELFRIMTAGQTEVTAYE